MITIETLTTFFGWSLAFNFGLLVLTAIFVVLMRDWASKLHGRMFKLDEQDISRSYFQFLAQYKLAILVFNVAPYAALKMMG
jgi:hypothetical protein